MPPFKVVMSTNKTLETTKEFLERMVKEAKEKRGVFDVYTTAKMEEGKVENEMKEENVKDEERSGEEKVNGKKRKHDSQIKVCQRYHEDDANITTISSDGVSPQSSFLHPAPGFVSPTPPSHILSTRLRIDPYSRIWSVLLRLALKKVILNLPMNLSNIV
jgi:hypothetical protein